MKRPIALLLLAALPARAELAAEEWKRAQRDAAQLAAKAGEGDRKLALIDKIGEEDSGRAARLLVEFAAASVDRRRKLAPRLIKARDDFFKVDRRLRKKHGRGVKREKLAEDSRWQARRDVLAALRTDADVEEVVQIAIGRALGGLRSAEAIAQLVDVSDRKVMRARQSEEIRRGVLDALWRQPRGEAADHILVFATDGTMPHTRARVLRWIGIHKIRKGYDVAVESLEAKESAVTRSAVLALKRLNDARCVPVLIQARQKASGLLAEEIEIALHHFTGESFFGSGADVMWAGWWRDEGASWLDRVGPKRYAKKDAKRSGDASFYGIETRSNRVVFVLDRSGSMAAPVPQRGPITGKDKHLPGKTKLEVAKNQLARTIRKLDADVRFAVVFYSRDVKVWKNPPRLIQATSENKRKAIDWFTKLEPDGSTMIFAALHKALAFAKVGGGGKSSTDPWGADTIYLLSDGAPTVEGGNDVLKGPALAKAIKRFFDANHAFGCVVNTIGVGPRHNRALMMTLARETGGTYKAVGTR